MSKINTTQVNVYFIDNIAVYYIEIDKRLEFEQANLSNDCWFLSQIE